MCSCSKISQNEAAADNLKTHGNLLALIKEAAKHGEPLSFAKQLMRMGMPMGFTCSKPTVTTAQRESQPHRTATCRLEVGMAGSRAQHGLTSPPPSVLPGAAGSPSAAGCCGARSSCKAQGRCWPRLPSPAWDRLSRPHRATPALHKQTERRI